MCHTHAAPAISVSRIPDQGDEARKEAVTIFKHLALCTFYPQTFKYCVKSVDVLSNLRCMEAVTLSNHLALCNSYPKTFKYCVKFIDVPSKLHCHSPTEHKFLWDNQTFSVNCSLLLWCHNCRDVLVFRWNSWDHTLSLKACLLCSHEVLPGRILWERSTEVRSVVI